MGLWQIHTPEFLQDIMMLPRRQGTLTARLNGSTLWKVQALRAANEGKKGDNLPSPTTPIGN